MLKPAISKEGQARKLGLFSLGMSFAVTCFALINRYIPVPCDNAFRLQY